MSSARDEFFRRYAASPIHIPRLERLLNVYEDDVEDDAFSRKFIAWDRACPDVEAARIVTEILCLAVDATGRIVRLTDDAVKDAIRWMAEATSYPVAERARILAEAISSGALQDS